MRRDENWFDEVGKGDWRDDQHHAQSQKAKEDTTMLGKYKFKMPDGSIETVEAKSFVYAVMQIADKMGVRVVSASEPGTTPEEIETLPSDVISLFSHKENANA